MEQIPTLDKLAENITNSLKNGIQLKELQNTILSYNGSDWRNYVTIDKTKAYSRVCTCTNEHIEIIIITWNNNNYSKIHDHPENGCILRIMSGSLMEDVYAMENDNLKLIDTIQLKLNQVSYKIGNKYLHRICNMNGSESVSLHVYSPPNYKIKYYDQ